jgi:hypothetical protein
MPEAEEVGGHQTAQVEPVVGVLEEWALMELLEPQI